MYFLKCSHPVHRVRWDIKVSDIKLTNLKTMFLQSHTNTHTQHTHTHTHTHTHQCPLTLDDGQEDDDDEEEEGDVEDYALHLKLVAGRVVDLVADAPPGTDPHVHVEHVALQRGTTAPPPQR